MDDNELTNNLDLCVICALKYMNMFFMFPELTFNVKVVMA